MTRFIKILAAAVPLLAVGLARGEITGSKHDFSAASWSDQQICKPCHTPHNANVSLTGRIWAHSLSTASYKYHGGSVSNGSNLSGTTGWNTDTSTSMDAATGTLTQSDLDSATRLCLGCHDGTVALDSFRGKDNGSTGASINQYRDDSKMYNPNLGGSTAADGTITNTNVGDGVADLSNDHPVGFRALVIEGNASTDTSGAVTEYRYKPITYITNSGLKLAVSPYAVGVQQTFQSSAPSNKDQAGNTLSGNYYSVSCVSCHNVHNQGLGNAPEERGLLRISNEGSQLCLTCHNK